MPNTAIFSVTKKDFLQSLKKLLLLEKSNRKKDSTLEITLKDGIIDLVIPGVQLFVPAITNGSAKFTVLLWYIANIVKAEKDSKLDFMLEEGTLKLRGFSFNVKTTFFANDRILRSINLPMNYKYLDIVRLYLSERYTTEELEFNNLNAEVFNAIEKINSEIDNTTSTLSKYGFTREDVANLVLTKLK